MIQKNLSKAIELNFKILLWQKEKTALEVNFELLKAISLRKKVYYEKYKSILISNIKLIPIN